MPESLAITILLALAAYASLGSVFAAWFLARGVGRVDPAAAGSGVWFRLIILPGVVALWPVLALKARAAAREGGGAGGTAGGVSSGEDHS